MNTNPTTKQIDFLKALLVGKAHGLTPEAVSDIDTAIDEMNITKAEASSLIDRFVKAPWKCRKCGQPKNGRYCDNCRGVGGQTVEEGFYTKDGEIAVVKFNRAKTNKYAMRLHVERDTSGFVPHPDEDVDPDEFETERKHPARVSWDYEAGLINKIGSESWDRMTLEQAQEFGALYGVCMVCGRTLTDPKSIEAGIGPICAKRF